MKPNLYSRLLGIAFVLAASPVFAQGAAGHPPPQASVPPPPSLNGAWWHSESNRKDLELTNEQVARLDHIFQDVFPHLQEENRQLDERENKLSRLIETNADENVISTQIDRVETMRSALNKERQLMLVHMRAVLTPDQRVKFNDRWLKRRESQQQPQQRPQGQGPGPRPPSAGAPGQRQQAPPSGATPTKRPE